MQMPQPLKQTPWEDEIPHRTPTLHRRGQRPGTNHHHLQLHQLASDHHNLAEWQWSNYSRIGNGGSCWGGVTAAPGTTISAAVTPRGEIVPIVTPKASEPSGFEMPPIPAPSYDLPLMPRIPRSAPTATTKESHKEIPPPSNYNAYGKYAWLHNQLSRDCMAQLATDWHKESESNPCQMHDPHALLAYVRLWVRSHPGCLTGRVANSASPTPQKK
jgi:hypothetical protein